MSPYVRIIITETFIKVQSFSNVCSDIFQKNIRHVFVPDISFPFGHKDYFVVFVVAFFVVAFVVVAFSVAAFSVVAFSAVVFVSAAFAVVFLAAGFFAQAVFLAAGYFSAVLAVAFLAAGLFTGFLNSMFFKRRAAPKSPSIQSF